MTIHRNIRYARPDRCELDVYVPDEDTPATRRRSVIIVLHGGAWFLGDKSVAKEMSEHFMNEKCVVVTPCYRLSNFSNGNINTLLCFETILLSVLAFLSKESTRIVLVILLLLFTFLIITFAVSKPRAIVQHPVHANDVSEVVAWVAQNIEQYGGDVDNIFVLGHSAGGHLASIVSCNPKYLRRVNLPVSTIKGTICISGVFSDVRMKQSRLGTEILNNAFGDRVSYVDAFPIHHTQPNTPPHLLLNAATDYSLKRHTLDLFFALRAQGVYVQSKAYPGTNHFNIRHQWNSVNDQVLKDIMKFIHSFESSPESSSVESSVDPSAESSTESSVESSPDSLSFGN